MVTLSVSTLTMTRIVKLVLRDIIGQCQSVQRRVSAFPMLDGTDHTVGAVHSGIAWAYNIARSIRRKLCDVLRIDAHSHAKSDPRSQQIMTFN